MAMIIDRRLNGKNKSAVNREKFLRRYKSQIRKAVSEAIADRDVTDIASGEQISIPAKDIAEPKFGLGAGGVRESVHPGNTDFVTGDRIRRPSGQGGSGGGSGEGQASDAGEGEDDFAFHISRDEFMDLFFEDLELPDLRETQMAQVIDYSTVRAGFTSDGVPTNINVVRSLRNAIGRRLAMQAPIRGELKKAETDLAALEASVNAETAEEHARLLADIEHLKHRIEHVPFIDTYDLRFNNFARQPRQSTQAVMFCLMDVSGSMDQATKDMAKRFFMLLYMFLTRTYKHIEVVFIRHHSTAAEVSEEEFFYSRESGGTVVSSALNLMNDIIKDRFPTDQWNIYAAQASDGDNWPNDSSVCRELLAKEIMPVVRHYAYIEITSRAHQNLWTEYLKLDEEFSNFAMEHIQMPKDIYPVFRDLFKKRAA